ncbi:MAG: EAL domain-containing protein [Aquificota bacterium]|nr:EAL domain-containing protein [Aquificota bacterium]
MARIPEDRLRKLETASVDLLRSFLRFRDFRNFLRFIGKKVVRALDVDMCGVFRYDPEGDRFLLVGGFGWRGGAVGRRTLKGNTHAHYCSRTGKPVRSEDLGSEGRFSERDVVTRYGIKSLMAVPVQHLGRLWGVLTVYSRSRREFFEEEVEFLKAVAVAISEYLEKDRLSEELKRERRIFRLIAENAPVLIFIYREKIIYANPYAIELLGFSPDEIRKVNLWDLVHPDFREMIRENVRKRIKGWMEPVEYLDVPVTTKDGSYRLLKVYATTIRLEDGYAGLGVGVDVTRERELEKKLREEKAKLELILTHSHDVVAIMDREGGIRYKSPSSLKIFGWEPEEVVGRHFSEFVHPEDRDMVERLKNLVFSYPGKPRTAEFRVRTKTGDYKWVEANIFLPENWQEIGLEGAVVSERDITDRKRFEERILKATYYDMLTGLPNRSLFVEKLREVLSFSQRRGEMAGILLVDIADFSRINTLYGPEAGDKVLKVLGNRLTSRLRQGDLVSRFFADKFGVALLGIKDMRGLSRALDKVRSVFQDPFSVNGTRVRVDAYMGVALFPRDGSDPQDLIRKAEIALSRARDTGPNTVVVFSKEAEKELKEIVVLREGLKDAVMKDQIRVFYQPVFRLKDKKLVGFEALVRWDHPDLGLLPPSRFIQIAEDTGQIIDLGYCVLARAVRDLSRIHSLGFEDLFVAVNFSTKQFLEEGLTEKIRDLLDAYRVKPENFVVEITETTAMEDPERTKAILRTMREIGIKVAIDDFGTGYSSMNYLIEFDVDKIKIDRSFISAMVESDRARAVVKAVVDLSHSIGAVSLAEGIETEDHLNLLIDLSCDEGQGYYFAPPLDFTELKDFILDYL